VEKLNDTELWQSSDEKAFVVETRLRAIIFPTPCFLPSLVDSPAGKGGNSIDVVNVVEYILAS
jgi:hypothetical protein